MKQREERAVMTPAKPKQQKRQEEKGRGRKHGSIQHGPETNLCCAVWSHPFQAWCGLPRFRDLVHFNFQVAGEEEWLGREEGKKGGGGTKISLEFLLLLLSWEGLFSQSLHPEPRCHGNLLAAYKAVTAYSGVSASEPENVTGEVQFPGLLTLKKIHIELRTNLWIY